MSNFKCSTELKYWIYKEEELAQIQKKKYRLLYQRVEKSVKRKEKREKTSEHVNLPPKPFPKPLPISQEKILVNYATKKIMQASQEFKFPRKIKVNIYNITQ